MRKLLFKTEIQHNAACKWEMANRTKSLLFDKWHTFGISHLGTSSVLSFLVILACVDRSDWSSHVKRKGRRLSAFLVEKVGHDKDLSCMGCTMEVYD